MVHHRELLQEEALHAAFRHLDLTHTLTPKFASLVIALQLVNTDKSAIRCQGRCKNGGRCSQIINKAQVSRSVLHLQAVALDGGDLEEGLEVVFAGLLCGSAGHCTAEQVGWCVGRAKGVVECWRREWGVGDVEGGVVKKEVESDEEEEVEVEEEEEVKDDCKHCIKLQSQHDDLLEHRHELLDDLEAEQQISAALRLERDHAHKKLSEVTQELESLRLFQEEREQDLLDQLRALQTRYDGLLGRMASEVQQGHAESSRASSVNGGRDARGETPAFAFTGVGSAAERVRLTPHGDNAKSKAAVGLATPPPTPSRRTSSPRTPLNGAQLTPSLSTPRRTDPKGSNVLFKSGLLQTPSQNDQQTSTLSETGDTSIKNEAFIRRQSLAEDDVSANPWSNSNADGALGVGSKIKGEHERKPKAPFGFAVRPKG